MQVLYVFYFIFKSVRELMKGSIHVQTWNG